jgi:hypothetical protein
VDHNVIGQQSTVAGSYFDIARRGLAGVLPLIGSRNNLTGSVPMARTMATNSTTSIRRSPPSYLATKD